MLFWALIGIIGISMVAHPSDRWAGLVFTALGAAFAVRSWRSSCVVADDSGATTRSIVRTRRYPYAELRGVEVAVGQTGLNGFDRQYLVFHRVNGQDVAFKEFNSRRPKDPDRSSVVEQATEFINGHLQRAEIR